MNQFDFKNQSDLVCKDSVATDSGYILITGATGLVGQFLIKDLLLRKQKLALLVRPNRKQNAQQRVDSIIARWETELGHHLPRPIVLQGDLQNESLSLTKEQIDWVSNHCDRIIHNAAVLTFNGLDRNHEPWITNFNGTKNVLAFIKNCNIEELHYVSTAYVSGVCDTVFHETDFDSGQDFRNDYEHSKFEAEKLVRETEGLKSKTIYRPAVISGDSKTGFTPSYHGIYVYLRLMATMIPLEPADEDGVRRISIKLPMQGDEPRNLVAVDWVSAVMSRIICDPAHHNDTYHLVPKDHITARKLVHYSYDYFNSTGTTFADEGEGEGNNEQGKFAATYLDNMTVYADYEQTDPIFDRSNIEKICGDLHCPIIDKDVVFKYYDYGISDNWGKRKTKPAKVDCWLEKQSDQIREAIEKFQNESSPSAGLQFGLNVLGPGGGGWTIRIPVTGQPQFATGISPDSTQILSLDQPKNDQGEICCDEQIGRKLLDFLTDLNNSNQNQVRILS